MQSAYFIPQKSGFGKSKQGDIENNGGRLF
jgi:hypothetical protein